MVAEDKDSGAPLVSLAWRDMTVTATVVGVANSQEVEIYPRLDERLPHRKGVRAALQVSPRNLGPGAPVASTSSVMNRLVTGGAVGGVISKNRVSVVAGRNMQLPVGQRNTRVIPAGGGVGASASNGSTVAGKNLRCPICNKGFTKTTYLKRHILSHSGVKPYKCDICGWGFFQHCNLKRHMASHVTSGQSYKCLHCDAFFSTKSVLSVHMRDTHGDKVGAAGVQAAVPPPNAIASGKVFVKAGAAATSQNNS